MSHNMERVCVCVYTVISRLSMHFEPEPLVRTWLVGAYISHIAFRPSESMNHNGKRINLRQPAWPKSNLSRHWLNLKVLPISKALKLYTMLSSTSTTNPFALMFKRKLDIFMMMYDVNNTRKFLLVTTCRVYNKSKSEMVLMSFVPTNVSLLLVSCLVGHDEIN